MRFQSEVVILIQEIIIILFIHQAVAIFWIELELNQMKCGEYDLCILPKGEERIKKA